MTIFLPPEYNLTHNNNDDITTIPECQHSILLFRALSNYRNKNSIKTNTVNTVFRRNDQFSTFHDAYIQNQATKLKYLTRPMVLVLEQYTRIVWHQGFRPAKHLTSSSQYPTVSYPPAKDFIKRALVLVLRSLPQPPRCRWLHPHSVCLPLRAQFIGTCSEDEG